MLDFIEHLLQRYQRVTQWSCEHGEETASLEKTLATLTLAEAGLRKYQIIKNNPQHRPQIAVIGPTQAGKSTVVNALLGQAWAGVSTLAGYTVHAQGFCSKSTVDDYPSLPLFFAGYQQRTVAELSAAPYHSYALTEAGSGTLPPCVLWDTPDFDSIEARGYRDAVLRTAALADVLVLVVSKDKYADHRVWETLKLLHPLNQSILVCINKLTPTSAPIILNAFRQQLREADLPEEDFPLCVLHYQKDLDDAAAGIERKQSKALSAQLMATLAALDRRQQRRNIDAFIDWHWSEWLRPVIAEQTADQAWQRQVQQTIAAALRDYRRDYLDHPQNYATFQQAVAELLTLLEVPLLAHALNHARQAVTWPIRKLVDLGKSMTGLGQKTATLESNQEQRLLEQIAHHTLVHLAEEFLRMSDDVEDNDAVGQGAWWKSLARALRQERPAIEQKFSQAVRRYQKNFQPEIERSAQRLYTQLEKQPATLNALRAARVTTDAAAVVLAVKSGGIGAHDLVIAPAMLSLTSLLAEGTLGHYMDNVAAELKQRQLAAVNTELMATLQTALLDLKDKIDPAQRFQISAESLATITKDYFK